MVVIGGPPGWMVAGAQRYHGAHHRCISAPPNHHARNSGNLRCDSRITGSSVPSLSITVGVRWPRPCPQRRLNDRTLYRRMPVARPLGWPLRIDFSDTSELMNSAGRRSSSSVTRMNRVLEGCGRAGRGTATAPGRAAPDRGSAPALRHPPEDQEGAVATPDQTATAPCFHQPRMECR